VHHSRPVGDRQSRTATRVWLLSQPFATSWLGPNVLFRKRTPRHCRLRKAANSLTDRLRELRPTADHAVLCFLKNPLFSGRYRPSENSISLSKPALNCNKASDERLGHVDAEDEGRLRPSRSTKRRFDRFLNPSSVGGPFSKTGIAVADRGPP
jgi:hypothetical protein